MVVYQDKNVHSVNLLYSGYLRVPLAERLTPYVQKDKQWDNVLPAITFAINASVNSSTKYSPFEVVFGSRPKFPLHQHHTDHARCKILPDFK
jgi:hypothetical protein